MRFAGVGAILLIVVAGIASVDAVWPQPVKMTTGSTNLPLNPSTFRASTISKSAVLQNAVRRYNSQLFFPFASVAKSQTALISAVHVNVKSDSDALVFGVDESYTVSVSQTGAVWVGLVSANTVFGGLRGLETFSQLIAWNHTTSTYSVPNAPVSISDSPRFPWRGLLIDTSRHYLSISTIKEAIDVLSYTKFNTLHWHIVDAQSWPLESTALPLLTKAAYAPEATYTIGEVKDIIGYALERGVRVVPEFEMPGHAAAWGVGYPNTTAKCPDFDANINNVALDPSQPFVYQALSLLLNEMNGVFNDTYLHVGGDEVFYGCWEDDPAITRWMRTMGFTKGQQVENYFETKLFNEVLTKLPSPRNIVVWQEIFTNKITIPQTTTVEVWISQELLAQVLKAGYPGILAAGYYLDKQIPDPKKTWYEWVDTWKNFYENEPLPASLNLTAEEEGRFLGGEAAMWAEQVDSTNFISRVFPRSFGTAERLWSERSVTDINAALPRLVDFRCRVAQRGVGAGPVAPDYCPLPNQ